MPINVKNRTIFCKDNLEVMYGINSSSVDLIYLDPPFNKKKVFTAPIGSAAEGVSFKDWFRQEDVKDEWLQSIKEDYDGIYQFLNNIKELNSLEASKTNKHYLYNYCYLSYLAIRLIEMKRILKDTGSIYLHCDPTMSHYIKILMDLIFGEKNFRNEIVWCYSKWRNEANYFPKNHDIIFLYQKTDTFSLNLQYEDELNKDKLQDIKRGYHSQGKRLLVYDPDKPLVQEKIKSGKYDKIVYIKEKNLKGTLIPDYWNIPSLRSSPSKERTGYPTQKPLALLDRIIRASSNKGDIVLDPFCGCATTCVAAERLGRQWIGIDTSIKAYELVKKRLEKEVVSDLFEIEKEVHFSIKPPVRTDLDGDDSTEKKYVYIISHPQYKGFYKVGIAKDYKSRLNSYQTSDPMRQYKLEFKYQTSLFREIERYVHQKFDNLLEWVQADLEEIKKEIKNYKKNG